MARLVASGSGWQEVAGRGGQGGQVKGGSGYQRQVQPRSRQGGSVAGGDNQGGIWEVA